MSNNTSLRGRIVYQYRPETADFIANVTDTSFEDAPGTSYQVQISNLDVDLPFDLDFSKATILPIDVGGVVVSLSMKAILANEGCAEDCFRPMSVNRKEELLWQLCAPMAYELINPQLEPAPNSDVFRGPLDNIVAEVKSVQDCPIGCIRGREDYQDLFFSDSCCSSLRDELGIDTMFRCLPLYNDSLLAALGRGEDAHCSNEDLRVYCTSSFLNLLSSDNLLAILRFAKRVDSHHCFEAAFDFIKKTDAAFAVKKQALLIRNRAVPP